MIGTIVVEAESERHDGMMEAADSIDCVGVGGGGGRGS